MSESVPTVADLVGLTLSDAEGTDQVAAGVAFETLRMVLEDDLPAGLPEGRARRVLEMVTEMMAIPVPEVLMTGWRKYRELLEYTDPERHPPGVQDEVPLAKHTFRSAWTPEIDILVNGAQVATLAFDVELELSLDGAVLVIQDGRVVMLSTGECEASGKVSFHDRVLFERTSDAQAIPGTIRFGDGIPIDPIASSRRTGTPA
jgi:hypothetical protein